MDKISIKILEHLIASGGCKKVVNFQDELDTLALQFNMDSEDLRATIRYLNSIGYIEYMHYSNSERVYGFYLSHKGRNWRKFRREETIKYLKDKWIDFFAMLISFIALAVSVIALISGICP